MPPAEIVVAVIGSAAQSALVRASQASVLGVTSRGIFLSLPPHRVVFLSYETYRGPLTLNLQGDVQALQRLSSHFPVQVTPDRIAFPSLGLVLRYGQSANWAAPAPPQKRLNPDQIQANLTGLAGLVLEQRAGAPTSPGAALLEAYRTNKDACQTKGAHRAPLPDRDIIILGKDLQAALQTRQVQALATALGAFLGMGPGLTPSGDDLAAGFLLALHRMQRFSAREWEALGEALLPVAYQKTTTLSASLIECACQGQADERLVTALDGLLTGAPDLPTCAGMLLSWGSSSGVDALAGMALAFLNTEKSKRVRP
ncbi:MAG: DUF2877 domain-containing protein [Chloroflexota bacterium]